MKKLYGKDNSFYGRHHTVATKRKISFMRAGGRDLRQYKDDFIRLYEDKTAQEIATIYSVSKKYVLDVLRNNGVKMRKPAPRKGVKVWNAGKPYYKIRGNKNPNWKGGITSFNQKLRECIENKNWIRAIFKRDDWTCQICGQRGGYLEVDHYPKRFADIISENKIRTYTAARKCKELWDTNNGRTLCLKCHNKTKCRQVS